PSTVLASRVLQRDPLGERSQFYRVLNGRMLSSSRIHDLIVPGDRLNLAAIATYLTYAYLPHRETMVQGIYKVLPGEQVALLDGELHRSFHWQLPAETLCEDSEDELRTHLRTSLERAVTRRLPAGEPVGVTLSGGIDSSLVTALARQLHDPPVCSYAVS